MPLTKTGKKIMKKMKKNYKSSKKGKQVFYATMNKNQKIGRMMDWDK